MRTVSLTRKEHDKLCGLWYPNSSEQKAYLKAKRRWTLVGVEFKTDNTDLLRLVEVVRNTTTNSLQDS